MTTDRHHRGRAAQRLQTTDCGGQGCSRAKNYLLSGGKRAQDVQKESYFAALTTTALKDLRTANKMLADELLTAQTCAEDSLHEVHRLRQRLEEEGAARGAADTRVMELHRKVQAWKQRAEETLAIQKTAARAAEEKCAGLQCDLAAVRAELALEHRKTAAQTHLLKQRQQEADALAKALMERSVEVEDVSLELEREREHLADAEQHCLDANAVAAACRTEAKDAQTKAEAAGAEAQQLCAELKSVYAQLAAADEELACSRLEAQRLAAESRRTAKQLAACNLEKQQLAEEASAARVQLRQLTLDIEHSRAAQAESAQAKASQGRASRRLDDEAAQARTAVASCQAELTRTGALHQQELHSKDILISQLKAALTAEEAARTAAAEQQRLAQQDASRLQAAVQDAQKRQVDAEAQLAEAQGSLAALRRKNTAYDTEKRALTAMHDSWLDSLTQPRGHMLHDGPAPKASARGERDRHTHVYELVY